MTTPIFIFIIIALIAIYDVLIIVKKGKYESISYYLIEWSKSYPAIPFLFGFVMGHLFWTF